MCDPITAAVVVGTGLMGKSMIDQRRALRQQEAAQKNAARTAADTQRKAEQMEAKAARRAPDLASIFASNKAGSAAATLLTSQGGAPLTDMALGRNTLLGH